MAYRIYQYLYLIVLIHWQILWETRTILDIIFTIHPPTRPYKFSNDIDIGKEFIENYKTIPLETIDKDMIIDYLDVQ